jgi:hypothetical protein
MGFTRLHFLLAATFGNWKTQILARRDAKMGCKNLYRNYFLDVFGFRRSDGVFGFDVGSFSTTARFSEFPHLPHLTPI